MADRYWVGGTASWDGTAGTKWSATSGGAGGASVPTTADDVFFDANSTGTVTIATGNTGAKSINCTGFTGVLAGTAPITVAGSLTFNSTMGYTHTGRVTFTGSGTLVTAGKLLTQPTIDGAGITITLGDAFTFQTEIDLINGTFNTANYNVTGPRFNVLPGTKGLILGSSTVTLTGTSLTINFFNTANFTFSPGTSTFVLTGDGFSTQMGSPTVTFNNLQITSTGSNAGSLPPSTWNNITITPTTGGAKTLNLTGDVTATSLTVSSPTFANRVAFRSNAIGTARTLTVGTLSADHCDFEDITLAGAASPASPTGAGDCGGNSNITFPSPKTVYRVGTNTTHAGSSSWATSSGGTGSDANFPLPQDTAIIDNATTASSISIGTYSRGAFDLSSRSNSFTVTYPSASTNFYGSLLLGSGVTLSGTLSQTYRGRSTSTINLAGKTLPFILTINAPSGGLQLGSAFSSSTPVTLSAGTFNANNYSFTAAAFTSSNSNVRTLTMGSGLWTLTGTSVQWDTTTSTNLTFNKGTADILLSNTSTSARVFSGGSLSYNKLTIGGATGVSTLTINGASTFTELASTKTVAHTIRLGPTASGLTLDKWSIKGTAGNVVTLNSTTTGTRRTFNLTNAITSAAAIDYLAVQDIEVLQANRFYVGANSTNNGNNVNVIFTAAPAGAVTIDVPASDIGVAAVVPTISSGKVVLSPAVNIAVSAFAPIVNSGKSVSVPVSNTGIDPLTPVVNAGKTISVPTANTSLSQLAPNVVAGKSVQIPLKDFQLLAYSPSVEASLGGLIVPSVNFTVEVLAPTVAAGKRLAIPSVDTSILARVPTVVLGNLLIVPSADTSVSAQTPAIVSGKTLQVPATNVSVQVVAPTVTISGISILIPSKDVQVSALAPTVRTGKSVRPTLAQIDVSGVAPAIFAGKRLVAPLADVSLQAFAPDIGKSVTLNPPSANITLAARTPTILKGVSVGVNAVNVTVLPLVPRLLVGFRADIPAKSVTIVGQTPAGVGFVGTRRYVSITEDSSANIAIILSSNAAITNNGQNEVSIDGLYNQAV